MKINFLPSKLNPILPRAMYVCTLATVSSYAAQQYCHYNMNMCGMSDQYSYLIFAMCNMTGLRPIILA